MSAEDNARAGYLAAFKGDYSPGGLSGRSRRRARARRAGLASGVKRRQLARGRRVPHAQTRDQALALAYRHRQLSRADFAVRYREIRPTGNARGLETAWQHYVAVFTRYRMEGQHYRTTNGERRRALERRARPRCRRQVQRLNRLLEAMGLAHVAHYRDRRDTPGHRDCLVIELRTPPRRRHQECHPLPQGGEHERTTSVVRASPTQNDSETDRETATTSVPPAAPAENVEPATPAVTERQRLEAHLAFLDAKIAAGWCSEAIRFTRAEVRLRLRALTAPPPAPGGTTYGDSDQPRGTSGDPQTAASRDAESVGDSRGDR